MRVVTSDKKITNLTSQEVSDSVERVRVTNGSNRAHAAVCDMPPVAQWDQIVHNEFVDGINKGMLIPIWVRTLIGPAYGRNGYTKSDDSHGVVEVLVRSVHDFDWSMNLTQYDSTDPMNSDSAGPSDPLARLKWGQRLGVQTGFPFRAELAVPYLSCGPTWQDVLSKGHHEYEMVGAVVCKYPIFHEYTYHRDSEVYQVLLVDIPTSRADFMSALETKMSSLGGELDEVWQAHKAEKYLPYVDGEFTNRADDADLLHQRCLLYRDGATGKWFATAMRGGSNGYTNIVSAGFTYYDNGQKVSFISLNLLCPRVTGGSWSEYVEADPSRADLLGFVYQGDTDVNDPILMGILMPLCESFTSAEKHPTWFDADGNGIPSEFFLTTSTSLRKFDSAALYESHEYWESKPSNNSIRTDNPNLTINENGTYSYLSQGANPTQFGVDVLENYSLFDNTETIDQPVSSSAYHRAGNVNASLGFGALSTVRVWRDVSAELKTMLISDAKDMF
jgi:hypothetical protein